MEFFNVECDLMVADSTTKRFGRYVRKMMKAEEKGNEKKALKYEQKAWKELNRR